MKFSHKSVQYSKFIGAIVTQHPVDIIEPDPVNDDVLRAVEAYNAISHWVLGNGDPSGIGRRALCIFVCVQRTNLPRRGIFRSVENNHAEEMVKKALLEVLTILVNPNDLPGTGRKVVAAFSWIRKEILGAKTLTDLGRMLGCKKQAIAQNQARFEKALRKKFTFRSRRGNRIGKSHASTG